MVNVELTPDMFQPSQCLLILHFVGFDRVKKPSFSRIVHIKNTKELEVDSIVKKLIRKNVVTLANDLLNQYLNHEDFFMTIDGMVIKEDLTNKLKASNLAENHESFIRLFNLHILPILQRMSIIYQPDTDFFQNVDALNSMMLYCQKVKDFYPLKSVFA